MRVLLRTLVLAIATTMVSATVSKAQKLPPIKEAVFFGDSLTDAGTFGFRFTTMPGLTWAQHVALHFGQSPLPNQHVNSYSEVYIDIPGADGPGGLNYAQGGARTNLPYSASAKTAEGAPISTTVQLQHFLKQHGSFAPDQLVALYIGTNDIANNYDPGNNADLAAALRSDKAPSEDIMKTERARVEKAGAAAGKTATDILANGAKRLIVFKLARLGDLPWFHTKAAQDYVNDLTIAYNNSLLSSLPKNPAILIIDVQDFVDELTKNADKYGFKYFAHEDACQGVDPDYCYVNAFKSDNADRTYIFAGNEHMTTYANELLAKYVLKKVAASPLN